MIDSMTHRLGVAVLILGASFGSHANLISNGTFDTDLSDWDQGGTIGTFWDAGTAHLGRPGQNGESIFSQEFQIEAGASYVKVGFDYQWQIDPPSTPDTFSVQFAYADQANNQQIVNFLTESSAAAVFGQTVEFLTKIPLINFPLAGTSKDAYISFSLDETVNNPSSPGSRIQLDNVSVTVPVPATLALLGLGMVGIGYRRRREQI